MIKQKWSKNNIKQMKKQITALAGEWLTILMIN